MNWLKSIFGKDENSEKPQSTVTREGKVMVADESFFAWTSGELNQMLKAAQSKSNPIDRHFLLQSIVSETYKLRKDEKYRNICIEYSEKHLTEFKTIAPTLKNELGGFLPSVLTFQLYSTLLSELGYYEKAIEVCKIAISYNLNDSTKSGYEGRIERFEKKKLSKK